LSPLTTDIVQTINRTILSLHSYAYFNIEICSALRVGSESPEKLFLYTYRDFHLELTMKRLGQLLGSKNLEAAVLKLTLQLLSILGATAI
jgi:hypothetical protein